MTTVTSSVQSALSAQPYTAARFVTLTLPGYTFRAWTGIGSKTLNGNVYVGAGSLGDISPISDRSDLSAQKIQMTLTGLDPSLHADVVNYLHQGAPVEIIEAQMDQDGNVVPNSYDILVGEVDVMSMELGETLSVIVQVDNLLSMMFRGPDGHRRTGIDQQTLFSNSGSPDLGLSYVGNLLMNIPWGVNWRITSKTGGTSAGSGAAVPQPITD